MKRVGDMKHGLTSSARPKLSIVGRNAQVYTCRAMEYGAAKYARGNYHGDPPDGVSKPDRMLGYVDAAIRHLTEVAQAVNVAKGTGGDEYVAFRVTDDVSGGGFPASGLPHIAHALASLMVLVEVGVQDGILPADPGQPWAKAAEGLPQKDDPASERARVASLRAAQAHDAKVLDERQRAAADREEFEREFEKREREIVAGRVEQGGFDVLPLPQSREDGLRDMTGRPGVTLDGATAIPPHALTVMREIEVDAFDREIAAGFALIDATSVRR
jgi:hypothetical protein